jgi:hypothetical protein
MAEVWAAGVTYRRSREAREAESTVSDIYTRVYDADRPELFLKSIGWRVVAHQGTIRIRGDSRWTVPEPELTVVVNAHREIVGYCAGNDVSSRDIEGENPLYLPQAKVYDGSCALGPGILLADVDAMRDLPVSVTVLRAGQPAELAHELDHLDDGHLRIQPALLRQVPDVLGGAGTGRQPVEDRDRAGVGRDDAGEHLEGGRLARTVGTEEPHQLALLDLEADVIHGDHFGLLPREEAAHGSGKTGRALRVVEDLGEILDLDERHDGHSCGGLYPF